MDLQDLNFIGNDPGAAKHGNFINYYKFHTPDERIKLLPKTVWPDPCYCLDIGCNSGDMTMAFSTFLNECSSSNEILGIDIDPVLIERAKENCSSKKINFECINIMNSNDLEIIQKYLSKKKITKFNVVTCFSITMWIHLNNGDSGLRTFLQRISEFGEVLIIEPQPWKCYKTAVKRMRRANFEFPHFNTLTFRGNIEIDIENILTNEFRKKKIFETQNNNWGRKLLFFQ
ncbi:hypothetical protein WA026_010601 [Henosepilachna vigintioctopunctata]|uniref:RNA methyltransferase n=1 Tax=Henosepilachna vigintioctopunctata TaxID=420089 RepID=A0AAW1VEF5_9CUCU